jgi:enoyl-CoA hydratase
MKVAQITWHRSDTVAVVELVNPPRNLMTWQMVEELDALTRRLERDASVRAIVITGGIPDRFITHFDVDEVLRIWRSVKRPPPRSAALARAAATAARWWRRMDDLAPPVTRSLELVLAKTPARLLLASELINGLLHRLERMDKVVIAAINGPAIGGGCELALACDFRFMARGPHKMGLSEVTLGMLPGAGGSQRLIRLVGLRHATTLLLEGKHVDVEEAERIGLVHALYDPPDLVPASIEYAALLARRSPATIRALKHCLSMSGALEPALDGERAAVFAHGLAPGALRAMERYQELSRDADEDDVFELFRRGEGISFQE